MRAAAFAACALAAAVLAACGEDDVALPPPVEPGADAVAHFHGMLVLAHAGPRGQVWLDGREEPLWFASVRDALAYAESPEREARIVVVYVSDMGRAGNWDAPAAGAWVPAKEALFVLGSDRRGGMGMPEAVPFSGRAAAEAFIGRHGGSVADLERATAAMAPEAAE